MRSGRTGMAAAIVTAVLLVGACADEAGDGAEAREPTTTERPTTTTTTEPTTTTTAPADDDIPSDGDLAACAPYGEVIATWGGPEPPDIETARDVIYGVLDGASQAEDVALVAALGDLRTAVDALDVDSSVAATIAYTERCTALGAPLF
jgi:hypothetical protein